MSPFQPTLLTSSLPLVGHWWGSKEKLLNGCNHNDYNSAQLSNCGFAKWSQDIGQRSPQSGIICRSWMFTSAFPALRFWHKLLHRHLTANSSRMQNLIPEEPRGRQRLASSGRRSEATRGSAVPPVLLTPSAPLEAAYQQYPLPQQHRTAVINGSRRAIEVNFLMKRNQASLI